MRYLLTLALLLWAVSASAFTINGKTYSTWNGVTLATWNGVTAVTAPANALVPASNTGFESGLLSPWVDASSTGGGGAVATLSVVSTAEMTGTHALQLDSTGGDDTNNDLETGGPTDGSTQAIYTFPISAIDSTHKILTFDIRPKTIYLDAPGAGMEMLIVVRVFNGATQISDESWPLSAFTIWGPTIYQGGAALVPSPVVNTTYTVQADILQRAQGAILAGHTWAEATSVTVDIWALASGAVNDGAGGPVTNRSRLVVLVDNFR